MNAATSGRRLEVKKKTKSRNKEFQKYRDNALSARQQSEEKPSSFAEIGSSLIYGFERRREYTDGDRFYSQTRVGTDCKPITSKTVKQLYRTTQYHKFRYDD